MSAPNWKNKTVWTADGLYVLRGMNAESVDLICLDPPFNSKADCAAPTGLHPPSRTLGLPVLTGGTSQ